MGSERVSGMREPLRPLAILLTAMALAWMPHGAALPLWLSPLLLTALAYRFYLGWRGAPLPDEVSTTAPACGLFLPT